MCTCSYILRHTSNRIRNCNSDAIIFNWFVSIFSDIANFPPIQLFMSSVLLFYNPLKTSKFLFSVHRCFIEKLNIYPMHFFTVETGNIYLIISFQAEQFGNIFSHTNFLFLYISHVYNTQNISQAYKIIVDL